MCPLSTRLKGALRAAASHGFTPYVDPHPRSLLLALLLHHTTPALHLNASMALLLTYFSTLLAPLAAAQDVRLTAGVRAPLTQQVGAAGIARLALLQLPAEPAPGKLQQQAAHHVAAPLSFAPFSRHGRGRRTAAPGGADVLRHRFADFAASELLPGTLLPPNCRAWARRSHTCECRRTAGR